MCVVSMVMDHFHDKWKDYQLPPVTPLPWGSVNITYPSPITPEEINEFRKLLERAREYDKKNNEPDCELQEKKELVKQLAEKLGVKIDFLD